MPIIARLDRDGNLISQTNNGFDEVTPQTSNFSISSNSILTPEIVEDSSLDVNMRQLRDVNSSKLFVKGQVNENPLSESFNLEYLVIAGGGGMGSPVNDSGGGGAGGYRSSVSGERSGTLTSAEPLFGATTGVLYGVSVGAGGSVGVNGSDSNFSSIISLGGGAGGGSSGGGLGFNGGSGGGAGSAVGTLNPGDSGEGVIGQGTPGAQNSDSSSEGVGGGGAGFLPGDGDPSEAYSGGIGIASNVTGTPTVRAGGGGGGADGKSSPGGSGGGGAGGTTGVSGNGAINTGSGGGGQAGTTYTSGGLGGSGIVILRYPYDYTITLDPGLTATTAVINKEGIFYEVAQITEGIGNVSWQFRNI